MWLVKVVFHFAIQPLNISVSFKILIPQGCFVGSLEVDKVFHLKILSKLFQLCLDEINSKQEIGTRFFIEPLLYQKL